VSVSMARVSSQTHISDADFFRIFEESNDSVHILAFWVTTLCNLVDRVPVFQKSASDSEEHTISILNLTK
jgi:hypothetical protein